MYPQSVPAVLSKNVGNTLSNHKTWGGILYNVKEYDAKGDGSTDDTAAIQKAINASITGGWVYFPPGTYVISGTLTINKSIRFGGSHNQTTIITNQPTGDMLLIAGWYVNVDSLTLSSLVTRTSGYAINNPNNAYFRATNLHLYGQYDGIFSGGVLSACFDVTIRDFKRNGYVIDGGGDHTVGRLFTDNVVQPSGAGILISGIGAVLISDSDIIRSNICLHLSTTTQIFSVMVSNTFFDSSNKGLVIDNTGPTNRIKFTNCWFSSHLQGIEIKNPNSKGIDFVNCDIYDNDDNGVQLLFGEDVSVIGSRIGGNGGAGVSISSSFGEIKISDNTIGSTGGFGENSFGVFIDTGDYRFIDISNNIFSGNTNGNVIDTSTSCLFKSIRNNIGFNPVGINTATPPVPASGANVINTTGYPVRVLIGGGTVSVVWINGQQTHAISGIFLLEPTDVITITYTVAPVWKWVGC